MFFYDDATFTVIDSAYIQTGGVPMLGVSKTKQLENLKVYSNPVRDHSFTIALQNNSGNYSYDLISTTGQNVVSGKIGASLTKTVIDLPKNAPSGMYFLSVKNNGNIVYRQALSVLE